MDSTNLVPSLPAAWYFSPEQFQVEKEQLFKKEWIFLGHAQELPDAGDYVTCEVMGIPVIVLRDFEQNMQVLLNVCRHRAAPLLTAKRGRLEKPLIMCQYHGWCYLPDGQFKHGPFLKTENEDLNLKKVHHTEVAGMIFVSFNPEPYPFEERKDHLLTEMAAANFKIDDYRYHSQIVREGRFNWKVWVEGFQECYHCPTIHPLFTKDFHLSKYRVDNKEQFSVHQCPRKQSLHTGTFEGLWLWVFPNCGLPCYEKVYYSMRVNPKSATSTELIYTFFATEQFKPEDESTFFAFVKQVTDEDIVICEQVQKNLEEVGGTSLYDQAYLNTARENGVQYFHELVRKSVEDSV